MLRRGVAGLLFVVMLGQSGGAAVASPLHGGAASSSPVVALFAPLLNAVANSWLVAQLGGQGARWSSEHRPLIFPKLPAHEREYYRRPQRIPSVSVLDETS